MRYFARILEAGNTGEWMMSRMGVVFYRKTGILIFYSNKLMISTGLGLGAETKNFHVV